MPQRLTFHFPSHPTRKSGLGGVAGWLLVEVGLGVIVALIVSRIVNPPTTITVPRTDLWMQSIYRNKGTEFLSEFYNDLLNVIKRDYHA